MRIEPGIVFRHPSYPDWGSGLVLPTTNSDIVEFFFLAAGRKKFKQATAKSWAVVEIENPQPILKSAAQFDGQAWSRGHRNIYVVELDQAVLDVNIFLDANPKYDPTKLCVYVGMTGLSPGERLENHLRGHKAAGFVRRFGVRLRPELFAHFNPMPYELAKLMEVELARQLREQGYGVWQN